MSVVTQRGPQFVRDLTPIHRLPPEIIAEIFVYCIPSLTVCEPDKLPKFIQSYTQFKPHPRQIRAILSRVCRRWRTVLNNEPRAWGTLALDYSTPNAANVLLWLKRSKSCPLDVCIDPEDWESKDQLPEISALFYDELPRIRTFFATDYFLESFSILPEIRDDLIIELPRMESLTLINFDLERPRYCINWNAYFSFPRLRTLVLREFEVFIDGSMDNVHHLDISERTYKVTDRDEEGMPIYDPSWSYQFLQIVPNLVSLTWDIQVSSKRLEPPVELPSLKFLSLPSYGANQDDALKALQCFVALSLENLDIDLGWITPPDHEVMLKKALDVICRHTSVQLRHLTLRCSPKPSVNRRAMSPHLNHLETFTIDDHRPSSP